MSVFTVDTRQQDDPRTCYVCADSCTMVVTIEGRVYTQKMFLCNAHFNEIRQGFRMSEERL